MNAHTTPSYIISKKRQYLNLAMQQPIDWLRASVVSPTAYMTPMHVALVGLAIRRKRGMAA